MSNNELDSLKEQSNGTQSDSPLRQGKVLMKESVLLLPNGFKKTRWVVLGDHALSIHKSKSAPAQTSIPWSSIEAIEQTIDLNSTRGTYLIQLKIQGNKPIRFYLDTYDTFCNWMDDIKFKVSISGVSSPVNFQHLSHVDKDEASQLLSLDLTYPSTRKLLASSTPRNRSAAHHHKSSDTESNNEAVGDHRPSDDSGLSSGYILHVENVTSNILFDYFTGFGKLQCAPVVPNGSGESRGFGFVVFLCSGCATIAVQLTDKQEVNSKCLFVSKYNFDDVEKSYMTSTVAWEMDSDQFTMLLWMADDDELAYCFGEEKKRETGNTTGDANAGSEKTSLSSWPLTVMGQSYNLNSMKSTKPCMAFASYVRYLTVFDLCSDVDVLIDLNNIYSDTLRGSDITLLLNFRELMEETWRCLRAQPTLAFDQKELQNCLKDDFYKLIATIESVINSKDYSNLLACRDKEAQVVLDLIQDILDSQQDIPYSSNAFRKTILRLSKASGLHPRCLTVSNMSLSGDHAISGGAFADVWKGTIQSTVVATKVIRVFADSDKKALIQEFLREAVIWGQLKHPNLLPFYGLYKMPDGRLCLLSPWMDRGNVVDYLRENASENRLLLAHDIAHGVDFLHQENVIHGDLKGLNILINDKGRACISDFGLASLAETRARVFSGLSSQPIKGGTARWQAPQIIREGAENTFASDIYALGTVFYELFAGLQPYYHLKNDAAVFYHVVKNDARPEKPDRLHISAVLSDRMWSLIENCWNLEPSLRPQSRDVVQFIHDAGERSCPAPMWDYSMIDKVKQSFQEYSLCPSSDDIAQIIPFAKKRQLAIDGLSSSFPSYNPYLAFNPDEIDSLKERLVKAEAALGREPQLRI